MTDEDVEKVARAIEAQLFRVQELGTGRGIVTPEDIARAALDASPVSRLEAEVEDLTKERDRLKNTLRLAGLPP
jgi:cob(I)alamin adenosyltransferase